MQTLSPNPFRLFISFTKKSWVAAAIATSAVAIGSSLNIYQLVIIKEFTDAIVERAPASTVWQLGLTYPAIHLAHAISWRVSGFAGMRWFHHVREVSYKRLYEHVIMHDKSYFSDRFAGALLNKITNVVEGLQNTFQRILWEFLPITLNLVFTLYIAYFENWLFSAVLLVWICVFFLANLVIVQRYLAPSAYESAESRSDLSGRVIDSLSNISTVHAFAAWRAEQNYVNQAIRQVKEKGIKNWIVSENLRGFNSVMMVISNAAMVVLSLHFLYVGQISLGSVLLIIGLSRNLADIMWNFSSELRNSVTDYSSSREGLDEILQPRGVMAKQSATQLTVKEGSIALRELTFSYGKEEVLQNISTTFEPGSRVGLVGRSGAGKSTLVALLLRDFDPQGGEILIDNQSIATVTLDSLRHSIAYVPQDTSLFHRSLADNIRYAKPEATDEEVQAAAQAAHAHEFIMSLPAGYDTLVGERGIKLSGGQRQRIAIARAFLKNAPILILDEATSSLDSESELAIQKSLQSLMKGKTVIAIAHRLSTLREMDRILVLEEGKIKEDGTPAALLLKKTSLFKKLWDHQISGFIKEEEEN